MKSLDSHIESLKEQFESVGTKFNGLTWDRIKASHESYAQQYINSNKELVEMLGVVLSNSDVPNYIYDDAKKQITRFKLSLGK